MAILTQVPADAQISRGETKEPIGVIDERLDTEGDMLRHQALQVARQRGLAAQAIYNGTLNADVIRSVDRSRVPGQLMNMNMETLNALANGTLTRDQAYVGSNANFTGYYLEPAAKFVIPQYTPLRNRTPRVPGVGIDTINWRAVTDYFGGSGPNIGNFILQQQGTPQKLSYNWVNRSNVFKQLAVQDVVTFESEIYGRMWQGDVRATVAAKLIPALMQGQEMWMINGGQKCWPPAPANNGSTAATGGTITAGTYWIVVTAVNANGETLAYGGSSPVALKITTTGSTSTVTFNINRVPGAVSYNVYVGSGSTQPANSALYLQSATTQFGNANALNDPGGLAYGYFTVTATAAFATTGTAYSTTVSNGNTAIMYKSTDPNTNGLPLVYDGMLAQIFANLGTNSTVGVATEVPYVVQPASSAGTLVQSDIDSLLEKMFLNAHADPDVMYVSVRDHRVVSQIVAQGTNFRVNANASDANSLANLVAGGRATKYINQTTGKVIDIIMLPYLTQGTIVFGSDSIPYPVSAIDKPVFRMEVNKEMWAMELPPDQGHPDQWMYNAFCNETMVNQFLGGWGAITGIVF